MGVSEPRQGRRGVQGNQGNQGDEGSQGVRGAQGARGLKGDPGDGVSEWMNEHPGTVLYIALMVTASVGLQLIQVFW